MAFKFENFPRPEKKVETGRDMQEFARAFMLKWENPEKEALLFYNTMKHRNEGVLGSTKTDLSSAYFHSLNWADSLRENPKRTKEMIEMAGA